MTKKRFDDDEYVPYYFFYDIGPYEAEFTAAELKTIEDGKKAFAKAQAVFESKLGI